MVFNPLNRKRIIVSKESEEELRKIAKRVI